MKRKILLLSFLFIYSFSQDINAQPNYSNVTFKESLKYINTGTWNGYYLNGDLGYLNEFLSTSFTIEFWAKILPNTDIPSIINSDALQVNFPQLQRDNGTLIPGVGFMLMSYDNTGSPLPGNPGIFYHATAAEIPNDGKWMHIALVKNYNQPFYDPNYPLETGVQNNQMGIYVNGQLLAVRDAPATVSTVQLQNFIFGNYYNSEYLAIDEFRFWEKALVRSEIEAGMNSEASRTAGGLILHYDFNVVGTNSASYFPNKSRGWGSPTTDDDPDSYSLGRAASAGQPFSTQRKDVEYTSTKPGDWNDPATWGGVVPLPGEIVNINHAITLSTPAEVAGLRLNGGKLTIDGVSLTLHSPPSNGNTNTYIKTENGGSLKVSTVYSYGANIPMGGEKYNPLYVYQDNSNKQSFVFKNSNDLAAAGVSGSHPIVNNLWYITPENGNTTSKPLFVKMYWHDDQEQNGFITSQAKIGNFHNGEWNYISVDSTVTSSGMTGVAFNTNQFSPFIPINNIFPLPVSFSGIFATVKDGFLKVNWTTENETDNSHFIIEASTDGKSFKSLGTVQSKARDGNSNDTLSYDFEIDTGNIAFASLAGLWLLGLILPFTRKHRRLIILSVMFCTFGFIACNKKQSDLSIENKKQFFIRILQVDKDGTKTYSKIIKAVEN